MCENVYDMIIVGSGPAGLTAGIYGKRAGLKVVILESGFIQGGQIVNQWTGTGRKAEGACDRAWRRDCEREGERNFAGRRVEDRAHKEGRLSW